MSSVSAQDHPGAFALVMLPHVLRPTHVVGLLDISELQDPCLVWRS